MLSATDASALGATTTKDDQCGYLMIKPPLRIAKAMDALRVTYELSRKYAIDHLHFTLVRIGDLRLLPPKTLELIRAALRSLQVEPFEVSLNRIDRNALVGSNMRALRDFQRLLVDRLVRAGVDLPDYSFNPHVSLTYQAWQHRHIKVAPLSWRVDELLLVNSVHGKGHRPLGSWNLKPRQGRLF